MSPRCIPYMGPHSIRRSGYVRLPARRAADRSNSRSLRPWDGPDPRNTGSRARCSCSGAIVGEALALSTSTEGRISRSADSASFGFVTSPAMIETPVMRAHLSRMLSTLRRSSVSDGRLVKTTCMALAVVTVRYPAREPVWSVPVDTYVAIRDAGRGGFAVEKFVTDRSRPLREQTHAAAHRDWEGPNVHPVDEIVFEQRLNQVAAAMHPQVRRVHGLELLDLLDDVARDKGGVLPRKLRRRVRNNVLLGRVERLAAMD
jgi:hypothetical protein